MKVTYGRGRLNPNQPLDYFVVPTWAASTWSPYNRLRPMIFEVVAIYPGYRSIKTVASFDGLDAKKNETKARKYCAARRRTRQRPTVRRTSADAARSRPEAPS
jgi:hypothetical protein